MDSDTASWQMARKCYGFRYCKLANGKELARKLCMQILRVGKGML